MRKVDHPTRLFASPQCGTGFWDGFSPLYEMQRVDQTTRLFELPSTGFRDEFSPLCRDAESQPPYPTFALSNPLFS